jgi:hypothetical protein
MNRWVNFLSLVPGTILTILVISIAFLRFYDESDFQILGQFASPRLGRNRLTLAAILVALVNFGLEWNDRNRETDRRIKAKEQTARRTRVETERDFALLSYLSDPSESNRLKLTQVLSLLDEYKDTLV